MLAALLTVAATVILVQVVMAAYLQGVARTAADEAVRTGSRVTATTLECEQRAQLAVTTLLPGPIGSEATVACSLTGGDIVSTVTLTWQTPTPGVPTMTITATGRAINEP